MGAICITELPSNLLLVGQQNDLPRGSDYRLFDRQFRQIGVRQTEIEAYTGGGQKERRREHRPAQPRRWTE